MTRKAVRLHAAKQVKKRDCDDKPSSPLPSTSRQNGLPDTEEHEQERGTSDLRAASVVKHDRWNSRPPIFFFREYEEPCGYLCQWYLSDFEDPGTGLTFNCAEQWMMWHKAQLFDDSDTAAEIMGTPYPKDQKALGRCVQDWDESAWDEVKSAVVEEGNYLKFTQTPALKVKLLATGERELVEASRSDRVWGIGFNAKEALSRPREDWGQNLLGKALMRVRERIRNEGCRRG